MDKQSIQHANVESYTYVTNHSEQLNQRIRQRSRSDSIVDNSFRIYCFFKWYEQLSRALDQLENPRTIPPVFSSWLFLSVFVFPSTNFKQFATGSSCLHTVTIHSSLFFFFFVFHFLFFEYWCYYMRVAWWRHIDYQLTVLQCNSEDIDSQWKMDFRLKVV